MKTLTFQELAQLSDSLPALASQIVSDTIPERTCDCLWIVADGEIVGLQAPTMFRKKEPVKWSEAQAVRFSVETKQYFLAGPLPVVKPAKERVMRAERPQKGEVVHEIPVDELVSSAGQPRKRFSAEALSELAASVKFAGVLQPLVVRIDANGKYEIVFGERRWRAAKLVGCPTVPVLVRNLTNEQVREMRLVENIQREDLSPMEEARGFAELLETVNSQTGKPYTQAELAEHLGKSEWSISAALRLVTLPADAADAVDTGKLSARVGYLIASIPGESQRAQFAKEVLAGYGEPMSVSQAEEHRKAKYVRSLSSAPFDVNDATLPGHDACKACRFNSALAGTLKQGERPMCSNIQCFDLKIAAHVAAQKQKVLDAGGVIFEGSSADRLLYHDGTPRAGWVDIHTVPSAAVTVAQREAPKWATMFKKASPKLTGVVSRKGNVHMLAKLPEAIEAARLSGFGDYFSPLPAEGEKREDTEEERLAAEREEKAKREAKIEHQVGLRAMDAVAVELGKRLANKGEQPPEFWSGFWDALFEVAFFHAGGDALAVVCKRRKLQDAEPEKAIRAHAKDIGAARVPALALELLFAAWVKTCGVSAPGFALLTKALGLDVKAIRADVKAEMSPKKAATAPATT